MKPLKKGIGKAIQNRSPHSLAPCAHRVYALFFSKEHFGIADVEKIEKMYERMKEALMALEPFPVCDILAGHKGAEAEADAFFMEVDRAEASSAL